MSNKKRYIKLNKNLLILSKEKERFVSKILLWCYDTTNQYLSYPTVTEICTDFSFLKYKAIFVNFFV